MPKKLFFSPLILLTVVVISIFGVSKLNQKMNGAPPYGEPLSEVPKVNGASDWFVNWTRPEGPARVGLQVGHWENNELPEELEKLKGSTGASGGGKSEWEVNYEIAIRTKKLLEERGVVVDLIPATVPEEYWADVFLAIHADGSLDTTKSGYKVAGPWRERYTNSNDLVQFLDVAYEKNTQFEKDPNITRNMRGYYAFSWWRYDHSIHPMTTAAIIETGFLSSPNDRLTIVDKPEVPAKAIAEGIISYLDQEGLLKNE